MTKLPIMWNKYIARNRSKSIVASARHAQSLGDWALAEMYWRKVTRMVPHRTSAWIQLGNMLNELKRYEEAIISFETASMLSPESSEAPAGIAGVYERLGQWRDAHNYWVTAEDAAKLSIIDDDRPYIHARLHRALSLIYIGFSANAMDLLEETLETHSETRNHHDYFRVRCAIARQRVSGDYVDLFRELIKLIPNDKESVSLDLNNSEDLYHLASRIHHNLMTIDEGKFESAAILYSHLGMHSHAAQFYEADYDRNEKAPSLIEAFNSYVAAKDVEKSKILALKLVKRTKSYDALDKLLRLYREVGLNSKSRYIAKFLVRVWPHSDWHRGLYIELLSLTGSLTLADRAVQKQVQTGHDGLHVSRAYAVAAFNCGEYSEAKSRIKHHLNVYQDPELEILLGYATANSDSIDEAEGYFRDLVVKHKKSLGSMMGVAHMLMRKRDHYSALEQWREILAIHPHHDVAKVEIVRATFVTSNADAALAKACELLRVQPGCNSLREVAAWILTSIGRHAEALEHLDALAFSGNSTWTTLSLKVVCLHHLGLEDRLQTALTAELPPVKSLEGQQRLYELLRYLVSLDRASLGRKVALAARVENDVAPWLWPYLSEIGSTYGRLERQWQRARSLLDCSRSDRLDRMTDEDIDIVISSAKHSSVTIAIVNKFEQPRGGSELHAIDLSDRLEAFATVNLVSPEMPHPYFTDNGKVSPLGRVKDNISKTDVLVIIGAYFDVRNVLNSVSPSRVIILYNTFDAPRLFKLIEDVGLLTSVKAEVVYCSSMMRGETLLPGRFEPSPTDLEDFYPRTEPRAPGPLKLGRHSRDVFEKHSSEDRIVYQCVSAAGGKSVLIGATCMADAFSGVDNLSLSPAQSTGIADYLRSLDIFFYRTSTWVEPWGRVVIEAMACGLPVVVHSRGGYAEIIDHGVNGFTFDTTEEAASILEKLMLDDKLRAIVGREARKSVETLLGASAMNRLLAFYLLH